MRSVKRLSPDEARQVRDATCYSYQAGELPPGSPQWLVDYTAGDGGLLNALDQIATSDRLLAAVRERDNTIARVRDIVESVHVSDGLDPDGYQVAGLIRAALDPQETP